MRPSCSEKAKKICDASKTCKTASNREKYWNIWINVAVTKQFRILFSRIYDQNLKKSTLLPPSSTSALNRGLFAIFKRSQSRILIMRWKTFSLDILQSKASRREPFLLLLGFGAFSDLNSNRHFLIQTTISEVLLILESFINLELFWRILPQNLN